MNVQIHEFVVERLQIFKGHWAEVAEGSGVPLRTIEKIARRTTKNPGVKHVEALADFFSRNKKPKGEQGNGGGSVARTATG